jgi:hypothetical protein
MRFMGHARIEHPRDVAPSEARLGTAIRGFGDRGSAASSRRRTAPRSPLVGLVATAAGALALWLAIGVGFVNYDTLYSLVWGQQVTRGEVPAYSAPLAPTPHPLLELVGVILAPLGAAATQSIVVALAYLSLAWLGYLVFRLGSYWFSWPVGLAATAIILSRYEVLSYGVRAYADIPYVDLVLAALAVETRHRRAGWPVLALLCVAGLLRPEAWLFSAAYWLYLWPATSPRERARNAAIVVLAPLLWALSDLVVTGNSLWSLTNTRSTAKELGRPTGILNVPYYGARRLGEVLGPDGLVAVALGGVFTLWLARSRARVGLAAAAIAVVAFALVAAAGLSIQDRYVFLIAALGAIFGGAGLFGWHSLPPDHPRRRLWQASSLVIAIAIVASIPWQVPRFHKTFIGSKPADQALSAQQRIADDLVALVGSGAITARCLPISVPYATPVPLLALRLHTSPRHIVVAPRRHGTYLETANAAAFTQYQLDPRDQTRPGGLPTGFTPVGHNRSWLVYSSCD